MRRFSPTRANSARNLLEVRAPVGLLAGLRARFQVERLGREIVDVQVRGSTLELVRSASDRFGVAELDRGAQFLHRVGAAGQECVDELDHELLVVAGDIGEPRADRLVGAGRLDGSSRRGGCGN